MNDFNCFKKIEIVKCFMWKEIHIKQEICFQGKPKFKKITFSLINEIRNQYFPKQHQLNLMNAEDKLVIICCFPLSLRMIMIEHFK
mgnify:CR=1 FL=1